MLGERDREAPGSARDGGGGGLARRLGAGGAGRRGRDRTRGERAAAAAPGTAAAAGFALAPLGHHTLLATWLATLLPLALLPLRERSAWRWLGAGAGALGVAGVVAGGSLAGGAALACEALAAALWLARRSAGARLPGSSRAPRAGAELRSWRRLAGGLALLGMALAASQLPRLARIVARQDASALARGVYLQAGWNGWRERPWLGWGPGSAPWTAAWFLAPRPGLNPWGEAVGELHSLPVHLAYETGAIGLLSALLAFGAFMACRWTERRAASDPGLLAAGCLGLAGAAVASLGTAAIAVPALPLAAAVAAGAALAGGAAAGPPTSSTVGGPPASSPVGGPPASSPAGDPPASSTAGSPPASSAAGPGGDRDRRGPWHPSWAACIYGLAAATALLPAELARLHYGRAVAEGQAGRLPAAASELRDAVRLDPRFPLYRMRLALLREGGAAGQSDAAMAFAAARDGNGVGLLWLVAGILGLADRQVWPPMAFEQACALDPLSALPPFYLAVSAPDAAPAPRLGARALLANPRLMAATFWEGREPLFRRTLEEVRRWPGVDAGWKLALLRAAPAASARRGAVVDLALTIDPDRFNQATSLVLFSRLPWLTHWRILRLRAELLAPLALPPATSLPTTDGRPFVSGHCGS